MALSHSLSKINDKHHHRCPHCGHPSKPAPSPFRLRRNSVLKLNRVRNNGMCCLSDDDEGRRFLRGLLALNLPRDDIPNRAPWVTAQELREIEKRAARSDPTPANVGRELQLTDAERKQHKLWPIWSCGSSQEDMQRENDKKRNERRREKRAERIAQIRALSPREAAVIEAMKRLARQFEHPSVQNIRSTIAKTYGLRSAFLAANGRSFRRVVLRSIDRLEALGLLQKSPATRGHHVHCFLLTAPVKKGGTVH